MQKRNKRFILLFIFIPAILFAGIVILKSLKHLLENSDSFRIKNILVNGIDSSKIDLDDLKGLNTFQLDLKKVSSKLSQNHPSFCEVSVTRHFPNELSINFKERQPIAKARLFNKYFLVDEYRVLINLNSSYANVDDLPLITGLETSINNVQLGKPLDSEELDFALDLIKRIDSIANLKNYKLNTINASNFDNLSFLINPGLEIKVDRIDYKAKLNVLAALLEKLRDKFDTIKYIDLRFKDPIIKTK